MVGAPTGPSSSSCQSSREFAPRPSSLAPDDEHRESAVGKFLAQLMLFEINGTAKFLAEIEKALMSLQPKYSFGCPG